jgi:predicted lipoprotein with Yx(FWY)xxD motif
MILMVVGLTLAACGSDEPAATVAPPPATIAAAAEATTFELTETDLGPILVGADGLTHYMFAPDEQGASTCYEQCAANWPPLVERSPSGSGYSGRWSDPTAPCRQPTAGGRSITSSTTPARAT